MAGNFVDSLVIGIGLDTSQIAEGVQKVGAQLDSGLSAAAQSAASKMSPLGEALKNLSTQAEGIKEPVQAGLDALHGLGLRSTEEIQQAIDKLKEGLEKIKADVTLTDRDKAAAVAQTTAQIERLEKELKQGLPQAAQQGFAGAEAAAGKFKGFISSIWAQISGPLLGAFAIGGTISSYISNATAAGELADRLKVDVEEIQIWSGAMERAGGSAASLQTTIEKLNASGKANGDAIGVLLGLADQAEAMSKEAFVQKAKELEIDEKTIEVLQRGRKALEEHLKTQKELGAYRKEDAENARKFKQALSDLLAAWDGLTSYLGRLATPVMEWAAKVLKDIVVFLRNHAPMTAAALTMIGAAIAYKLLPPLRQLPAALSKVWAGFLRFAPFVVVIGALALLFDDLWGYMHGEDAEFSEFWAILGTGPELLAKWEKGWKEFKETASDALNTIRDLARNLNESMEKHGAYGALAEQFKGNIELIKGLAKMDGKTIAEGLWDSITGSFKVLSSMNTVLGDAIVGAVKKAFSLLPSEATLDSWEAELEKSFSGFIMGLGAKIHQWSAGLFKDLGLPPFDEVSAAFDQLMADIRAKISKWWDSLFSGFKLPRIFGGDDDEEEGPKAEPESGQAGAKVSEKARGYGEQAADALKAGLGKIGDFFGDMFKDAQPATEEAGAKVESGMKKTADVVQQGFNSAWNATRDFAVTQFQGAAVTIQGIFAGIVSGIETQVGNLVMGAQRMMQPGMVPAAAGVRAQNAGNRSSTFNQQNKINVYAPGGDPAKVQQGVQRGLNQNGRTVRAAASGTVQK